MQKFVVFSLWLLSLLSANEALRLLVLFPMPSKSHSILGHGFVNRLLEGGHEVVHVTSFPREKPDPKLTEVNVGAIGERYSKLINGTDKADAFKLRNVIGKANIGDSLEFFFFANEFHKQFLHEDVVIQLLSNPKEKFDAVIVEWFFHEFLAGVASLLQCPLIWVGSTEAHWQILRIFDEIPNPSYVVDLFSSNRAPLTFWQRFQELWMLIKKSFIIRFIMLPLERNIFDTIYTDIAVKRGVKMPSYEESVYNASLTFLNSHPSLGTPFKLPQNAKYIGGYHINNKVEPLPANLQKLMDGAKDGVIYFSMGSNLKSVDMSDEMRNSFLKLFGKLKQTVIWKFEADLDNVPYNVHLLKWAPQQSILTHPNLKTFITHGGLLSTIEAVHYGVPIIGIPVMADQHVNMQTVAHKGFGIKINLQEDLATGLAVAIKDMLTNPSYKAKAKELSLIYHDRLATPGAELVHWVEHVVRTGGALHLRSPALFVPWYQKTFMDLAVLIAVLLFILVLVLKRLLCKRSKVQKKVKKN